MIDYQRHRTLIDAAAELERLAANAMLCNKLTGEERQAKVDQLKQRAEELRIQAKSFARI